MKYTYFYPHSYSIHSNFVNKIFHTHAPLSKQNFSLFHENFTEISGKLHRNFTETSRYELNLNVNWSKNSADIYLYVFIYLH